MAVEGLIYRLLKASPLLAQEMDDNIRALADANDGLEALLFAVLNTDGSLKTNAVTTDSVTNRIVTTDKLSFQSAFYSIDSGAVNALKATFNPAASGYVAPMVIYVKAGFTNTATATLAIDGLAPVAIKQSTASGLVALAAGNIVATGIYEFLYDGTQFVLLNPTPTAVVTGNLWTDSQTLDTRIGALVQFDNPFGDLIALSAWTLVCEGIDGGFNVGDEIDLNSVWFEEGATVGYETLGTSFCNTLKIGVCITPHDDAGGAWGVVANSPAGTEVVLTMNKWRLRNRAYAM